MKAISQTYRCQMLAQSFGTWIVQCHLHIFQPHAEMQVVVIEDMGFEIGWFIPHVVEKLIEHVVSEFHLDPAQVVWIEHYTSDIERPLCADFSQVTFEWQNEHAMKLRWTSIAPEMAEALINTNVQLLSTPALSAQLHL